MALILVVEDDPDNRELLATYLVRAGHRVNVAANGREALAVIGTGLPDVVVLDILMPQMDGIHFLDVLRSYLGWKHLPVIVVTALPGDLPLDAFRRWQVKRVYRKVEYRLDELLACINNCVAAPPAPAADAAAPGTESAAPATLPPVSAHRGVVEEIVTRPPGATDSYPIA